MFTQRKMCYLTNLVLWKLYLLVSTIYLKAIDESNQIKSDLFRHHISQKDESGVFTVQTIVNIKHTLIIE